MNWWRRRGLRFKMALGVSLILILVLTAVMSLIGVLIGENLRSHEERSAAQLNTMFVNNTKGEMVANNWSRIQEAAEEAGREEDSQIEVIAMYGKRKDPSGLAYERTTLLVFASGFPGGRDIPRSALELKEYSADCAVCHSKAPSERQTVIEHELQGETVLRTAVALRNEESCQKCHGTEKAVLGMSLIDFRLDRQRQASRQIVLLLGGSGLAMIALVLVALYFLQNNLVVRPLRNLVRATQTVALGDWGQSVPVYSADEVGKLGMSFNEMTTQLAATYAELQQALAEREEKAAELQQALDQVQQGHAEQERLLHMIREMSTPVIPVHEGVLVMPLVGVVDSARARNIVEALLPAIEKEQARVVILDITGVPMVDTAVAQALLLTARAAQLLGAVPVLVGITPPVAETIVALGVDLSGLVTKADLRSGLEYAMKQLRPSG